MAHNPACKGVQSEDSISLRVQVLIPNTCPSIFVKKISQVNGYGVLELLGLGLGCTLGDGWFTGSGMLLGQFTWNSSSVVIFCVIVRTKVLVLVLVIVIVTVIVILIFCLLRREVVPGPTI